MGRKWASPQDWKAYFHYRHLENFTLQGLSTRKICYLYRHVRLYGAVTASQRLCAPVQLLSFPCRAGISSRVSGDFESASYGAGQPLH